MMTPEDIFQALQVEEISLEDAEKSIVEYYTLLAERSKAVPGVQKEYLTFCPFAEKIPGFSMSRISSQPEKHLEELGLIHRKQTEMRQVLFCREDFQQVHTLFDIGCGHGTDLLQIASLYPHVTTHGFTIIQAQAELGQHRSTQLHLSSQVHIWHKDSSKDPFPAQYDLIIGIEVACHIPNKKGLLQNIASSLNEHGRVLLTDYVANLPAAIVVPRLGIYIPTQQEWLDLLTAHHLIIDEIIDVSPRIANSLDDPYINDFANDLPRAAQALRRSYALHHTALANGWTNYCLWKLKKDTQLSISERWQHNAHKIAHKTPYPQALADMLKRGHIPYPPNPSEKSIVEYYTFLAQKSKVAPGVQTEYITFCPFAEKIPGFSMSRVFLQPEKHPEELRLIHRKQTEMRQVLFCREDFQQVHTLFDIGCGHGTDLLQIASLYPHVTTHGFTIIQAQAELGTQRSAQLHLSSQVHIWHKDTSKDPFPAQYDLIIGIEVACHIPNKKGLLQNIASSLNTNGKVLLMDYVANLPAAIAEPRLAIYIPTQQEWLDLLTAHHLIIDEIIDVSPQIANSLDDPYSNDFINDLPRAAQDLRRGFAEQQTALENGRLNYCLWKLKKDAQLSASERWQHNAHQITHKTLYPQALADMLKRGHIPYPLNPNE